MRKNLMINSFNPENAVRLDPAMQALIQRRDQVLGPSYKLFYEEPVHVVRASGVWLYDPEDRPYLDVYNNVPAVGHCNQHVIEAVTQQIAKLNIHTRYLNEVVLDYAERLIGTFPQPLSKAIFTCTGSEASDLAMRIAYASTGNTGIIVTENGYHGITASVAAFSPSLGAGVPLGPHVRTIPAPNAAKMTDVGLEFANHVFQAMDDLERHGIQTAALITDTIFSSDGVFAEPAGFLRGAVDAVRSRGGIFIADEVQPGLGRTGTDMWGFQRHHLVPDLVVLGKPMGNGLPLAGVIANPDRLENFSNLARYFNTFGGNPISCAAGLAVLEVMENEGLMENANRVGTHLMRGLGDLAGRFNVLSNIRGTGLFIGADLDKTVVDAHGHTMAERFVNRLRDRRILISTTGPKSESLKIRPPLPFSMENADYFLEVAASVLKTL